MVSTTSAAAQANEMEKKRKQTFEKAKANHLSRQLQMRLQYARLKVEHGWQRQNLNEVENLYFHHSHQRGPRSFPPSAILTPTPTDNSSTLVSVSKYSDLSYKGWPTPLSRSSTLETVIENSSRENLTIDNNSLSVAPTSPALPSQRPVSSRGNLHSTSISPTPTEVRNSQPSQNPATLGELPAVGSQIPSLVQKRQPEGLTSAHVNVPAVAVASTPAPDLHVPTVPHQGQSSTTLPFSSGSISYMPTTLAPAPTTLSVSKKPVLGNKNTSMTKDSFGSNSTSLTYDSFWSGLQSKSYSTLKNTGVTVSGTEALGTDTSSSKRPGSSPNGQAPSSTPTNTTTTPVISIQNAMSTPTSTPPPSSSSAPSYSQLPTTSSSSSVPVSAPLTAPLPPSIPSSFSASMPVTMSLTMPTPLVAQTISPQVQMQMANQYLNDSFVPWSFGSAQPSGGTSSFPHNLIPASLLTNPAFLANLSASYAHAFGGIGSPSVHHPSGITEGIDSQTTPSVVAPPNVSVSPTAPPPIIPAFLGQQES